MEKTIMDVFKNNVINEIKALQNDEEFVNRVLEAISETYDVNGLAFDYLKDKDPVSVLDEFYEEDLIEYAKNSLCMKEV